MALKVQYMRQQIIIQITSEQGILQRSTAGKWLKYNPQKTFYSVITCSNMLQNISTCRNLYKLEVYCSNLE